MGSSASKFRKAVIKGDEATALHVHEKNSHLLKAFDPNEPIGTILDHQNSYLHFAAKHGMKDLLR